MLKRSTYRRLADGGLDTSDPTTWRVDAFIDAYLAAISRGKIYGDLMNEQAAKRMLRGKVECAERDYREHHTDPMVAGYTKYKKREYIAALDDAIQALDRLCEAGPLHVSLPESWRCDWRDDEYRNAKEDHVTQCFFVDSLKEKADELRQIRREKALRGPRRPISNDAGLWKVCIGLWTSSHLDEREGLTDPKLKLDILEAVWMDAGLPERHNARNGETLREWISKYLKRLENGWKNTD